MTPFTAKTSTQLLSELDEWRSYQLDRRNAVMEEIIGILRERGVYCETQLIKFWISQDWLKGRCPYMEAVEGYGAYWHTYRGYVECPHCHADLRDYESGPPMRRIIACHPDRGNTFVMCPDCERKID
jgi:uncharacterized protein with PIN domain